MPVSFLWTFALPSVVFFSVSTAISLSCRSSILAGLFNATGRTDPPDALYIMTWCRLGNALYQLAQAINYASYLGISDVFIERNFSIFRRTFITTNKINVHVAESYSAFPRIYMSLWFYIGPMDFCMRWDFREIMSTFRSELFSYLPQIKVNASILYLHVRSGDIFVYMKHAHYGQPPCKYYLAAADIDGSHSAMQVVSENGANPCVPVLINGGALFIKMGQWHAFTTLIRAHRFVLSRSTFALAAAFLAPRPQMLYTFAYPWPDIGGHWNCEPTEEYQENVLKNWRIKRYQIRLMMRSECKEWVRINDDPNCPYKHHGDEGTPFRTQSS
jgi:hypothetical protein